MRGGMMKALKYCANGDGNPVCPPSKVICRQCMDKITRDLKKMINNLDAEKEIYDADTENRE